MPYRFVRARPNPGGLAALRDRLDDGDVERMDPFGPSLTAALERARFDPDTGEAVFVVEDYCSPPLSMERAAVLDDHFAEVRVVDRDVDEAEGWARVDDLPELWESMVDD